MSTRKGQTPHAGHARTPPDAPAAARQVAQRPPAARPKSPAVAPPVYNPLPKPLTLQPKTHAGQPVRVQGVQPRAASQERQTPTPPPVYRPEPKATAQLKTAAPPRPNQLPAALTTQLSQRAASHTPQARAQSAAQAKPFAQTMNARATNARPPSTPAQTLNALARAGVLQRTAALPARGPHAHATQTQPRLPSVPLSQTALVPQSSIVAAAQAHARTQRHAHPARPGVSLQLKPNSPRPSPFAPRRGVIQRMEEQDMSDDSGSEGSEDEEDEDEDVLYGGYSTDVEGWHDYGSRTAKQGCKVHRLVKHVGPTYGTKMSQLYIGSTQIRGARSFGGDRYRQTLRWIATVLLAKYGGVEIQCYYNTADGHLYISSNKDSVNEQMAAAAKKGTLTTVGKLSPGRKRRHQQKLEREAEYDSEEVIKKALDGKKVVVPSTKYGKLDYHAERRIKAHLGVALDLRYLAGTRRACMSCAVDIGVGNDDHPGPIWTTGSGLGGFKEEHVKQQAETRGLYSHVTLSRDTKKLTLNIGSDSDTDYESDEDENSD